MALSPTMTDVRTRPPLPRLRAIVALVTLCALGLTFGAAVIASATPRANRGPHVITAREYREAAAKAEKSPATRGGKPGGKTAGDPC